MTSSSPIIDALSEWLAEHPRALEPGLIFYDEPLRLNSAMQLNLHGVDPLGRPCIVYIVDEIEATTTEWMINTVACFRSEATRFSRWYPSSAEPRVFLVTKGVGRTERENLALLSDAFPLRVFSWTWSQDLDQAPLIVPEKLFSGKDGLDMDSCRLGQRIISAAGQIKPPVTIFGESWPLIFVGSHGPCATLYRGVSGLTFASYQESDLNVLDISDDESADLAIDCLLREQSLGSL